MKYIYTSLILFAINISIFYVGFSSPSCNNTHVYNFIPEIVTFLFGLFYIYFGLLAYKANVKFAGGFFVLLGFAGIILAVLTIIGSFMVLGWCSG